VPADEQGPCQSAKQAEQWPGCDLGLGDEGPIEDGSQDQDVEIGDVIGDVERRASLERAA
jgi:hypothetical protein